MTPEKNPVLAVEEERLVAEVLEDHGYDQAETALAGDEEGPGEALQ